MKYSVEKTHVERIVREVEAFVSKRPALEAVNTTDSLIANVLAETEELRNSHNESGGDVRFDPKVTEEVADPVIYLIQLLRRLESDAYPLIAALLNTTDFVPTIAPEDIEASASDLVNSENKLDEAKEVLSALIYYSMNNEIDVLSAIDLKNRYNEFRFPPPLFTDPSRYTQDRKLAKTFEKWLRLKERILYPRLEKHARETYMNSENNESSLSQKILGKLAELFKKDSEDSTWSLKLQTSVYSMFASGIIFSQTAFRSLNIT
jgi:hypothetical protein